MLLKLLNQKEEYNQNRRIRDVKEILHTLREI